MMNTNNYEIVIGSFTAFFFLVYNYTIFQFTDNIFKKSGNTYLRIAVSIFNFFLALGVYLSNIANPLICFMGIYLLLFIEFAVLYNEKYSNMFLIIAVFATNIMAVNAIVLSFFDLIMASTSAMMIYGQKLILMPYLFTLIALEIATLLCMKKIPVEQIHTVLSRKEQSFFLIVWLSVCTVYLLINTQWNHYKDTFLMIYQQQILSCVMILCGIFIMLFYSIKNCIMLDIKSENKELKAELENQESYRDALTNHAKFHYEVNLSQNMITKGFNDYQTILDKTNRNYKLAIYELCKILVHPEDLEMVIGIASLQNLIEEYERNNLRQTFECRIRDKTGEYFWTEFIISLIQDSKSQDIMAFAYFIDIDTNKRAAILLQNRAERDSLTGLYNKMTTESLIEEYMLGGFGMLFIIDVDNFKAVNDYFGHAKGDEVLRAYALELTKAFRTNDIIGRIGGDEFMVFLPIAYHEACVIKKAEDILRRFFKSFDDSAGRKHIISASIGIAAVIGEEMAFLQLYKQADAALYYAKGKGKNTYHIYQEGELIDFVSYISSDR